MTINIASSTAIVVPKNELLFRIIKIIDISYIIILYFLFAYIIGIYSNLFFEKIFGNEYEKKHEIVIIFEVIIQFISIGLLSYVGRNLIQYIPFPLDNVFGFKHNLVQELISGSFLTIFLIMFQYSIQNKIDFINKSYSTNTKIKKTKLII